MMRGNPIATHHKKATACRTVIEAFTLIEVMIVIVVLGIVAALAMPLAGNTDATRLVAASRLMMADIEFAQSESIAHPDDTRLIKLNAAGSQYWIAKQSNTDIPIDNPSGPGTILTTFGSDRGSNYTNVTIQGYSLGGDAELHFNAFGGTDQDTDATIILAAGGKAITITVDATTGEVSSN